ncbi:MAG: hypothetical protein AB1485_04945 [Candidatus Thermoplasmatota archaeon]
MNTERLQTAFKISLQASTVAKIIDSYSAGALDPLINVYAIQDERSYQIRVKK